MGVQVDHAFIGCQPGASEADALLEQGFVEGSSNAHPGQGTANRRFFFENFMLEFLWVVDQAEVTNEQTRRTRLWERCANSGFAACPFGILFRPDDNQASPPFDTWSYFPSYLPAGLAIEVAEGTTLDEPELFYLPFLRGHKLPDQPTKHRLPFCRVRSVAVGVRNTATLSAAAISIERTGQLRYFTSDRPVLELHFENANLVRLDLHPTLPLVLCGDHSGRHRKSAPRG